MAISHNPTRTAGIERAWLREIRRRWSAFSRSVLGKLREMQDAALLVNAPSDPFTLSPEQQRVYMAFVERQIRELLLGAQVGVPEATNWQARYQLEAYQRGLQQLRSSLIRQGARITPTAEERLAAEGLEVFTATPSLSTGTVPGSAIHQEALEFLYTRSYTSLRGWTDALARETRQILFDGVALGRDNRTIARQIQQRIGVSASRARTIAQTETNQAYARSSIAEVERASAETGEDVQLRWITARDSRVRHSHAAVHGVVMTTERAQLIKTTDGVNCRCALAPVVPGTNTAARRDRFERERTALLLLERK